MYSLFFLYAIIPLLFSHFFARFGADFIITNGIGHFESVKMHFFLILLTIATIEAIFTRWEKLIRSFRKYNIFVFVTLLTLFILAIFHSPYTSLQDLFLGIGEKQHGLLFPIGLIWVSHLTYLLSRDEKKKLVSLIIFSGVFVAIIALIESFGENIFTGTSYSITGSWKDIRSTSTLGNPNYVAGYLLMILPLVMTIQKKGRYILIPLLILGIFVTKSIIGLTLTSGYLLLILGEYFIGKKVYVLLPLSFLLGILIAYGFSYESEKWLSLISRFILMKHTIIGTTDSFWSFLIGHGPDSIMRLFSGIRPDEIGLYFPENMIIDSSHNIFIDIFIAYGCVGVILFIGYFTSLWGQLDANAKYAIIFGLGFLSLNVIVLSHMLVLLFLCTYEKEGVKV